ncbi:MAG: ImmA/IrrE family metallo-endopeptidase [Clostridiales bacterium]|nr:ImmA/IrrE family metallo-endopeptidase [Clostridiales bacterium]
MNARQEATKLLRETKQTGISVDLNAIANHLGVKLWEVDMAPFEARGVKTSGILYYDGKEYIIFINREAAPNRKRFTIAHEIGHYVLFKEKQAADNNAVLDYVLYRVDDYDFYSVSDKAEEKAANVFAAELLMPIDPLKKLWKEGVHTIPVLAAKFSVSTEAMRIRVSNCFNELEA